MSLDLAGIGIGPFNLSLAALLHKTPWVKARFFDSRREFGWHLGLMFDHATLQSPYLKDLVTLVDPTNPYSFLNYLARQRRLNRFIVASYENVPRKEFNQYFQWVCRQLKCLRFSAPVERLQFEKQRFVLRTGSWSCGASNVALGVGLAPNIPPEARPHLGATVFHGGEYLHRRPATQDQRIAVIGGGQTGAEIFYDLISDGHALPRQVTWVTRRHNLVPFDESAFANELYVPAYTRFFHRQPAWYRALLLERQRFSSDAILEPLLLQIYRRLYELDYMADQGLSYRLLADRRLAGIHRDGAGWTVVTQGVNARERIGADLVILATGFRFQIPSLLEPILDRIELDDHGRFVMNEDFSIVWDGPPGNRIYAHNAGLHSHGWIDPNFAGMAWRSAVMINSLVGQAVYDVDPADTAVDWAGDPVQGEPVDGRLVMADDR